MGHLTAKNEKEAIEQARKLTRIANIIVHNCDSDIEEIMLVDFLCKLRDGQQIECDKTGKQHTLKPAL